MYDKLQRLEDAMPDVYREAAPRVERVLEVLRDVPGRQSFLIGDVDLVNMLLNENRLCFFDLDDIGVGDPRRDLACLFRVPGSNA